ncbi:MAG: PadR family transcriptional regulator [Bacteroidota bacterium]
MARIHLGEFEELVLLIVAAQTGEAYGISVLNDLATEADRKVNISAVHAALRRLEQKGFVESAWSKATQARGGRRKRLFSITQKGEAALVQIREIRNRIWGRLPDLGQNLGFS